jgi:hypothetical protein
LVGLKNGIAMALDAHNPNDSLKCHGNKTASAILEFIFKLSKEVSKGKIKDAPLNTEEFWRKTGKDLISQISSDVWKCEQKSKDNEELIKKLGIDIFSSKFIDKIRKYMHDNRLSYYLHMKSLHAAFKEKSAIHAGNVFGHLLKSISSVSSSMDEMNSIEK